MLALWMSVGCNFLTRAKFYLIHKIQRTQKEVVRLIFDTFDIKVTLVVNS